MHNYSVPYRYTGMYVLARVESNNKLRIFDPDSLEHATKKCNEVWMSEIVKTKWLSEEI